VATGMGKEANKDLPTNVIRVGDSVSLDDAKFVALTLLRAGLDLKSIRRFQEGGGTKANLIEVGTDHSLLNSPSLSVSDVQNLEVLGEPLPLVIFCRAKNSFAIYIVRREIRVESRKMAQFWAQGWGKSL